MKQSAMAARRSRKAGKGIALRDLADMLSVDVSTVSRALNHDPRVNEDRAEKVRQLADQVGYRPRPLRSKQARSIGLLVTSTELVGPADQFLERIAWTTQRLVGQRRMHVNLECVPRGVTQKLPAVVQQNRVDGVILAGSPSVELVREICALGMPAVAINDSAQRLGIPCVRSNPSAAINQAILHLAARGHERFALLMKSLEYVTAQLKYESYQASLREIGIEPDSSWLVSDLLEDLSGGREGIRQLQLRGPLPTAILCENDWLALGAMQELQRQGINCPKDVSVVGHDDLWICEKLDPKLTSIHRSEGQLVASAVDLLVGQIEKSIVEPIEDVVVEAKLVWRDSTGSAPSRQREHQD